MDISVGANLVFALPGIKANTRFAPTGTWSKKSLAKIGHIFY